jgi:hypothetical protein
MPRLVAIRGKEAVSATKHLFLSLSQVGFEVLRVEVCEKTAFFNDIGRFSLQ